MRKLDRYILRETLVPTLIGLVSLTFVFLSRQIGSLLEIIVRESVTASEIWHILSAVLPNVLSFTLPMSVLIGILTGFGRMSSDHEVIALRASGISMRRILVPVMAMASLACMANLALTVWIAPHAMSVTAMTLELAAKHVSSLEVQPRIFNERLPKYILYVQDSAPSGMEWHGIMLADRSDPNQERVTFAKSGALTFDSENQTFQLSLTDSNTHIVAPLSPTKYSISNAPKMTIVVPIPPTPKTPDRSISETSTRTLWNRMRSGTATGAESVEFHRRFALPFACIFFALVALPLGVSTTRGSKSMGLVLSLILMFVYYLALIGGTRVASDGNFSPFLGTWFPNIAFGGLGIFLLARSDREHENRIVNLVRDFMEGIASRLAALQKTRERIARWAYSWTHRSKFFRVLDVYVLRGFWFFFFLVLAVFVTLFIIITLFELLPDIVKNHVPASIVATYFMFLLPEILYWTIPLTVLLATLINLGTLTKTNEILAVKAGAISLYRLAMPLLLMSLLLSGVIYFMQDFMLPYSSRRQDEYHDVIKGRASQTYRDPQRKWMVGSDDRIYHYNYFDPSSDLFAGISILRFQPKTFNLREWVYASRATWQNGKWILENGWIRKLDGTQGATYDAFTTLEFGIDQPDYFKREVRPASEMTYSELKKYVHDLQQSGFDVASLTLDLNRKLSFPLVCFIMAIIGIPFSFKTGRKGAFYGIGFCILIGIVYWSTFELFGKLGGINRLSPMIAAWFPNLIFGIGGIWMMLRVKT